MIRTALRSILAAATSAAILLTTLLADATPAPPAPRCARATYIRPSDGAIVTRTVCVVEVGK